MATVNDNHPNKKFEMSDEELKALAIQNYNQQEVRNSGFPTEIIKLPSKGLVYAEGSPLRSGEIEMKYMTAREEDILTSANLIKQGVVIDRLMQSMIISPINFNDLVIGDKNALMIAARVLGYGKDYPVEITCPECKTSNKTAIDLTQLPEQQIPDDVKMPSPGLFEFVLPQSKRTIHFKLLTTGIDKVIGKELEASKRSTKNGGIDRELTTRLKHLIVSVDGNADKKYISHFVDNELFAMDSKELRGYMKYVSPDAKFETNFTCTECGHEQEALGFGITSNFFWPK